MNRKDDPRISQIMPAVDAAKRLGMTIQGVYRAIGRGKLRRYKIGGTVFLLIAEVEAFRRERDGRRTEPSVPHRDNARIKRIEVSQ